MTDIIRWLYNRLEQFKTMDSTSDLFLKWINDNTKVTETEVEWA